MKGLQVVPSELERILLTHLQIEHCAVVGVADETQGQIPGAFVVCKSIDSVLASPFKQGEPPSLNFSL